jgi:IstB-like ATP binding protein
VSELVRARVEDHLVRLRMRHVAQRIDAMLSEAARSEPTYLDFLDGLLREEVDSKQRKRVQMGLTIAHFPQARTLEDFDFRFQPSVDQRLVKELSTGHFISLSDNVLIFGPPGVGGKASGDRGVRGNRGKGRRPKAAWKSLRDSHRFHRPTGFFDSINTGKTGKERAQRGGRF